MDLITEIRNIILAFHENHRYHPDKIFLDMRTYHRLKYELHDKCIVCRHPLRNVESVFGLQVVKVLEDKKFIGLGE